MLQNRVLKLYLCDEMFIELSSKLQRILYLYQTDIFSEF